MLVPTGIRAVDTDNTFPPAARGDQRRRETAYLRPLNHAIAIATRPAVAATSMIAEPTTTAV
jgi:hypothetical protein